MAKTVYDKNCLRLDVYGCAFQLEGGDSSALDMISSDFQFFICEQVNNPVLIEMISGDIPYQVVPDGIAKTYTPRNVSFSHDGRTYVDYSGRALAIWDRGNRIFHVYSNELDVQYEATYLFLLSQIGECLDARRMHRIHAMAMSVKGKSVLAILPMGGGKSTLCAALLGHREFSFLSDDSPFIASDARVHAFPLRLGLLPGSEKKIPVEQRRTIRRMEFGPKVLVNYEYFADRVIASADPGIVFLGKRSLSENCSIEPASAWEGYQSIFVNCVIGLGLFQGLEFVLNHSPLELISKTGVAWSRLRNARKLFDQSEVYKLVLGRDQERNAKTVRDFIIDRLGKN